MRTLGLAVVLGLVCAAQAYAAVKGGVYEGFLDLSEGSVDVAISFRTDDTLTFTLGDDDPFEGTYEEFDVILFSLWGGLIDDNSPDGRAETSGYGILSIVTIVFYENGDQGQTGVGFLVRVGSSTRSRGR